jgi:hypothetical protein
MALTIENSQKLSGRSYLYARLCIIDGPRRLRPCQVGPEFVAFDEPPHLQSARVEIVLTNGDQEQRHWATVLAHDPEATQIPVKLSPPHYLHPDPPQI